MSRSHTLKRFWWTLPIVGVVATVMAFALPAMATKGADHLDAPLVALDGRTDINDVYIFNSPSDPNNAVFIMTVNPLAGISNPTTFDPDAQYDFLIDTDFDGVKNFRYRFTFSEPRGNGQQRMTVRGPGTNVRGATRTNIPLPNGGMVTAGIFDDPFFFDLNGFQDGMNFTGDDFFAGLNVSALILEVPKSNLGSPIIGVWARTKRNGVQVDRMAFPLINTVLIPDNLKDDYNKGNPRADRRDFKPEVVNSLVNVLGNDPVIADSVADSLLPDILGNFLPAPTGFPNGRALGDDVADIKLEFITSGAVIGDGLNANDVPFRSTFPYLAGPH